MALTVDYATDSMGFSLGEGPFVLTTHAPGKCGSEVCSVHNPSDHHMRAWRINWRADRNMLERLCPHGIGHPDPDGAAYLAAHGDSGAHGCDGCCSPKHIALEAS